MRLLQNYKSLQAARRRYQAVLFALAAAALACGRAAATATDQMQRYVLVGLLLIFATTIVLFFATGVYSERISRAYRCALLTPRPPTSQIRAAGESLAASIQPLSEHRSLVAAGQVDRQTAEAASGLAGCVGAPSTHAVVPVSNGPDTAGDGTRRAHLQPASRQRCVGASPSLLRPEAFQTGYQRYRTQWLRARGQRGAEVKS